MAEYGVVLTVITVGVVAVIAALAGVIGRASDHRKSSPFIPG